MTHIVFDMIAAHRDVAYILVFLLLFFEGDALLFGVAFLAHRGVLSYEVVIPLIFFGSLISDSLWYVVGRRLDRMWPWLHERMEKITGSFNRHITENPERTLALVRYTYGGVCRATIMRVGALGVPYGRFLVATVRAVLLWMIIIGGLGYASSVGLTHAVRYLRYAEFAFMIGLGSFLVIEYRFARSVRKRL